MSSLDCAGDWLRTARKRSTTSRTSGEQTESRGRKIGHLLRAAQSTETPFSQPAMPRHPSFEDNP